MVNGSLDLKEWDKVWPQYIAFNKRAPSEILNTKAVFICRSAINQTKRSTKEQIRDNLLSPSRKNPQAPLASILINRQLAGKGKKGLEGKFMTRAVEKFIKRKQTTIGALSSGWIACLNILNPYYRRNKDIATDSLRQPILKYNGVKTFGKPKGTAIYARPDTSRPWAKIVNMFPQKYAEIQKGLQKAIIIETQSMKKFIVDKMNKNALKIFGNNR